MNHSWMSRLVFALFASQIFLSIDAYAAKSVKIRILSYNIKGLPRIINGSFDDDRFHDIGIILKERKSLGTAPDVVLVQESFSNRSVELQKFAEYPYVAKGPGKTYFDKHGHKRKKLLNSGLYVLSRYPIIKEESFNFPSNACKGWDCFSNKGAQLITIRVPGIEQPVKILNTHLQAGSEHEKSRNQQLQALSGFINERSVASEGLVMGGDFNTRPERPSFYNWLNLTNHISVGMLCLNFNLGCKIDHETDPDWILDKSNDQFFFSQGKTISYRPLYVERSFKDLYRGRKLSDHMGYEVIFNITSK